MEWAVHDRNTPLAQAPWETLSTRVKLDPAETTLQPMAGGYRVRFNYKGRVSDRLGRVTFMGRRPSTQRRCVFVSTLLGALRRGTNQTSPDRGGRYCY